MGGSDLLGVRGWCTWYLVDDFLAAITETLLRLESAQRRLAATRVIHTPRVSLDDALACHRCRKAQTADILKG